MATREVKIFEEQTGITATSDAFLVDPAAQISVMAVETASGSATVQTTIDPQPVIAAGNASWVNSPGGAKTDTFVESSTGPVTGVRLSAASGAWTLKVLQIKDITKEV